jgi:hypothetical protein
MVEHRTLSEEHVPMANSNGRLMMQCHVAHWMLVQSLMEASNASDAPAVSPMKG